MKRILGEIKIGKGTYTIYETVNMKKSDTLVSVLERMVKEGKAEYEPN